MKKVDLGLYLHVPFCLKKCPYCDFYSVEMRVSKYLENRFLKALKEELKLLKVFLEEKFGIKGLSFITFYAGGGTPSLLSPYFYEDLFNFLAKHFKFSPKELTLEANPETLTLEKTKAFYEIGFNRISLEYKVFLQRV